MGRDHEESVLPFIRTVPFTPRGEAMEIMIREET